MGIEAYIPNLAAWLGVDPSTALLFFGIFITVMNITGRVIPDDKVGILGAIRDLAKVIGLYAPNRITSGVTVNDVARATIGAKVTQAEEIVEDLAADAGALIPEVVDKVTPAFPDLVQHHKKDVSELIEDAKNKAGL